MMYNNKGMKSSMVNLGIVAAIGAATYMIATNSMANKQKRFKRNANKAVHSIGSVVNSISSMMK